jgi:hypothetical protein
MEREGLLRYLARFPILGLVPLADEQQTPVPETPRPAGTSNGPGDDSSVDIFA